MPTTDPHTYINTHIHMMNMMYFSKYSVVLAYIKCSRTEASHNNTGNRTQIKHEWKKNTSYANDNNR